MLLSLSNIENAGVELISEKVLRKILALNKKKNAKKTSSKKAKKVTSSKEELFKQILAEMNVEPSPKTKKKNKKLSRETIFNKILAEMSLENDDDEELDEEENEEEQEDEDDDSENEKFIIINKSRKSFKPKDISIKIASKEIRDSHYGIDVAKDLIIKNNKKYIMVSAYVKEDYVGKYLLKKNYYYLPKNEKFASNTFNEIIEKIKMIKKLYHEGSIDIREVTSSIIKVFGGIIGDVKFESEDYLGTALKRRY